MDEKQVRQWITVCEASGIGVPDQVLVLDAYARLLEARIVDLLQKQAPAALGELEARVLEEAAKLAEAQLWPDDARFIAGKLREKAAEARSRDGGGDAK